MYESGTNPASYIPLSTITKYENELCQVDVGQQDEVGGKQTAKKLSPSFGKYPRRQYGGLSKF